MTLRHRIVDVEDVSALERNRVIGHDAKFDSQTGQSLATLEPQLDYSGSPYPKAIQQTGLRYCQSLLLIFQGLLARDLLS